MYTNNEVELLAAASVGQSSTVRALAMGIAEREGLSLDVVADLQLAIGEACEMLIGLALPGSTLWCRCHASVDRFVVIMAVLSSVGRAGTEPLSQSAQWQALSGLSDYLRISIGPDVGVDGHIVTVELAASLVRARR